MDIATDAINEKLQVVIDFAFDIDSSIASLNAKLGELVSDMQGAKRPFEAGLLIGAQQNLKDSFYRQLGGSLQDMQYLWRDHEDQPRDSGTY